MPALWGYSLVGGDLGPQIHPQEEEDGKCFFTLKEAYWRTTGLPQLMMTDTWLQGVYGYAVEEDEPGVVLASYTWEDDSLKLMSFTSDEQLNIGGWRVGGGKVVCDREGMWFGIWLLM